MKILKFLLFIQIINIFISCISENNKKIEYYNNGNINVIHQFSYENSEKKLVQTIKYYYNGDTEYIENYLEKTKIHFIYYPDGNLKEKYTLVNNLPDGEFTGYYPNGNRKYRQFYAKGKIADGKVEEWYENGQINIVYEIKDSAMNGLFVMYKENGDTVMTAVFKNNENIQRKFY